MINLPENLDLNVVWKKYKNDLNELSFYDHPFESNIINHNTEEWLNGLKDTLNGYSPSVPDIINVPKKNNHLRPGTILSVSDAVIYQALVLRDITKIRQNMLWSVNKSRFSHVLKDNQTTNKWFANDYGKCWVDFCDKSISYINNGYEWVVFADVSAYFENISIKTLMEDLTSWGVNEEIVKGLRDCLKKWAGVRERGIPQGFSPSNILGEVYMNSIDERLKNHDIIFCRYVDDFRIFCKTKEDAINAMHLLTKFLREKGLNLHSAKSLILTSDEAEDQILGITKVVSGLVDEIKIEMEEILRFDVVYVNPASIERALQNNKDVINIMSIRRAFDENIVDDIENFDKTLFHFCINRLGALKDEYAVDFCLKCISSRPEELKFIIYYFSKLESNIQYIVDKMIVYFRNLKSEIKDYQLFLFLRWIYDNKIESDEIISFCRGICGDGNYKNYVRHYSWAILGEFGNPSDLDEIASFNELSSTELCTVSALCAIKKMPKSKRNSIYGQAGNNSITTRLAIDWAKN